MLTRILIADDNRANRDALASLLEAAGLDKDAAVLHVARQWLRTGEYGPTKTKAGDRRIALPADVREELVTLRLRSRFSQDEHPVFASRTGTPLGHRNVTRRGFEPASTTPWPPARRSSTWAPTPARPA